MMDAPLNSSNDIKSILQDVARFRALSPVGRVQAIKQILNYGEDLIAKSGDAEIIRLYAEEQKQLERQRIREFIARHLRDQNSTME